MFIKEVNQEMSKVIRGLDKFIKIGSKTQLIIAVLMFATIIISVTVNIVMRYIFDYPFSWTEELSIFLFVWIVFFGASVAAEQKRHVVLDLVISKIPKKWRRILQLFINLITIGFLIFVVIGGFKLQPTTMGQYSTTLRIEKNWYYIPVVISSIYMITIYFTDLIKILFGQQLTEETQGQRYVS